MCITEEVQNILDSNTALQAEFKGLLLLYSWVFLNQSPFFFAQRALWATSFTLCET